MARHREQRLFSVSMPMTCSFPTLSHGIACTRSFLSRTSVFRRTKVLRHSPHSNDVESSLSYSTSPKKITGCVSILFCCVRMFSSTQQLFRESVFGNACTFIKFLQYLLGFYENFERPLAQRQSPSTHTHKRDESRTPPRPKFPENT